MADVRARPTFSTRTQTFEELGVLKFAQRRNHTEYKSPSHYIREKAEISTANISKTRKLTLKLSTLINSSTGVRTNVDFGGNYPLTFAAICGHSNQSVNSPATCLPMNSKNIFPDKTNKHTSRPQKNIIIEAATPSNVFRVTLKQ